MTLLTALINLARLCPGKLEGIAVATTNGTTLTSGVTTPEANDWFNGGIIINLTKAKSATITDFAQTSGVFTFATQSPVWAAGDVFIALGPAYSRSELVGAINTALSEIGQVGKFDDSLEAVANQRVYDLPSGVADVRRVEVATSTDSDPEFETHYNWREMDGHLYFDKNAPDTDDYLIRLTYAGPHAVMSADADTISDSINPMRLTLAAFYWLLRGRMNQIENANSFGEIEKSLSYALSEKTSAERKWPIHLPDRTPTLSGW